MLSLTCVWIPRSKDYDYIYLSTRAMIGSITAQNLHVINSYYNLNHTRNIALVSIFFGKLCVSYYLPNNFIPFFVFSISRCLIKQRTLRTSTEINLLFLPIFDQSITKFKYANMTRKSQNFLLLRVKINTVSLCLLDQIIQLNFKPR